MSKIKVDVLETVDGSKSVNVAALGTATASAVANTPAGGIAATNVQAAINELDSEKFNKTGGSISGGISVAGNVLATSGAIGYGAGAGGTVTQATSKSTAVTLNKPSGRITMNSAALPTGTWVDFQLSNSVIGASDCFLVNFDFGSLGTASYQVEAHAMTGQACIRVRQDSGISLSEAVVINFQVIKGTAS